MTADVPTTLSATVRLGSGRYGSLGWTRHFRRLLDRQRLSAGIAAKRSYLVAVLATAAVSVRPLVLGTVRAAVGLLVKACGVLGVPLKGSGQTGRDGRNRLTDRSTLHTPRHATNGPTLDPFPSLSLRRPQSGAETVWRWCQFFDTLPTSWQNRRYDHCSKDLYRDSKEAVHPSRRVQHAPGCRDAIRRTGWAADGARRELTESETEFRQAADDLLTEQTTTAAPNGGEDTEARGKARTV